MSEWQPIETAPRDGSRVIVACYSPNRDDWLITEAWWSRPHGAALPEQCSWTYAGNRCMLDASVHRNGATHWQPLPAAPDIANVLREMPRRGRGSDERS